MKASTNNNLRKVRVINKHLLNRLKKHAALELFKVRFLGTTIS